ncbi:MAG: TssQ family T6SS-associated lipoprotein [Aquabacterium sp.]
MLVLGAVWMTGCATKPAVPAADVPHPSSVVASAAASGAAPASSAASEPARAVPPAEAALAQGVKAYQSGQYGQAEAQLKAALKAGLTVSGDTAKAHKHLAFIYCTSKREAQCLAAFKAAKTADPSFALSKAEAGHPMWAKAYKKAMGLK